MAIARDVRDILDVFIIENFAKISNFQENVVVPAGLQEFITIETVNNIRDLNFPRDVREILVNYILVKKLSLLSQEPLSSNVEQSSNKSRSNMLFSS